MKMFIVNFLKVDLKPWDSEEALTVNHQLYFKTVSHQQNCKKLMQSLISNTNLIPALIRDDFICS